MPLPAAMLRPWALAESAAPMVAEAYARLDLTALAQQGAPVREGSRAVLVDGVAIVPITGPLFAGGSIMDEVVAMVTGGSLYGDLAADFDAAMASSEARAVVLHFKRCPGGDADGCGRLSDRVYAARGTKPLIAVVESGCQSAGYWIGSSCDEMIAESASYVGCIGVKGGLIDTSAAEEKAGVKSIEIVADQSPDKRTHPVTDEVIARSTMHATEMAALFLKAVARNRGVSVEDVAANFGKGDSVIASKALAAGMIDGIGTLDDVLAEYGEPSSTAPATAPNGATQRGAPKMAIQRGSKPLRASAEPDKEEKKDDKAQAAEADKPETKDCGKCGGSGKNADGAECKHCEGSGEVEKATDDKEHDKAEHEEPDGDEEKHEGKKALAALSGLRLSASVSAHTAAIEAKMVPRAQVTALESRLAAVEAGREAEKASAETARLNALADSAEERGYFAGLDATATAAKRARFIKIARNEPDAADAILETLPAAKVAGRVTAQGAPANGRHSAQPKINAWDDAIGGRRVTHGDVDVIERGSGDLMQKAIAHAAVAKCSVEEAMVAVVKADPSLMQ